MAFYDRLIGFDDAGNFVLRNIEGHLIQAMMNEFARGALSGAQCQSILAARSGQALDAAGVTEIQALIGSITGSASAKLARSKEIEDVLLLASLQVSGYDRPNLVKTRLGL